MKNISKIFYQLSKFIHFALLFGCLLFGYSNSVSAKTKIIAVLIIVDKYEDESANNIATSVRNDYSTLSQLFTLLENRNLYSVEKITLKGGDTKFTHVKSTLEKINSTKDDIIFVYFSGHGGMDSKGTFLVCSDGESFYRKNAEAIISKKPNKFSVLITDACSNDVEGLTVMRSHSSTKSALEGKNDAAYKKLFDDYSGFMSISASSEGEYAWSNDNLGGFFTHYFFKEALIKNPKESWTEIFEYAKKKVVQMFNSMPAEQRSQLTEEGIKSQTPKIFSSPVSKSGREKTEPVVHETATEKVAIKLTNKTDKQISIEIDYNTDEKNWSESKVFEKKLQPSGAISIDKNCSVYFQSGKEEVGYELTSGNYEFAQVNSKEIDLFEEGESEGGGESEEVDYTALFVGLWELDDGEYISEIRFKENGTYLIQEEGKNVESGKWELVEDNEGYINLVLTAKGEPAMEFEISSQDDLSLELVLVTDGKPSDIVYYLNKLEY